MDVLERFHIYKTARYKPIQNKQYTRDSTILFDLVIEKSKGTALYCLI
jgi:hypothetical protein